MQTNSVHCKRNRNNLEGRCVEACEPCSQSFGPLSEVEDELQFTKYFTTTSELKKPWKLILDLHYAKTDNMQIKLMCQLQSTIASPNALLQQTSH